MNTINIPEKRPIITAIVFFIFSLPLFIQYNNVYCDEVYYLLQFLAILCFAVFLLIKQCAIGLPIAAGIYGFAVFSVYYQILEDTYAMYETIKNFIDIFGGEATFTELGTEANKAMLIIVLFLGSLIMELIAALLFFLAVLFKTLPQSVVGEETVKKLAMTTSVLTAISAFLYWVVAFKCNEYLDKSLNLWFYLNQLSKVAAFHFLWKEINYIPKISLNQNVIQNQPVSVMSEVSTEEISSSNVVHETNAEENECIKEKTFEVGHKWRCECGEMISALPCPFCGAEEEKETHRETEDAVVSELTRFKKLLDSNLITQEDYDNKKKELLGI